MSSCVGSSPVTTTKLNRYLSTAYIERLGHMVCAFGDTAEEAEAAVRSLMKTLQKVGNNMSDSARMRVTLDIPVDPSSASLRVMKAIASEQRDYTEVVLVKDREVTLSDHVEVINVHVHTSQPGQACGECVEELAMDGRS